MSNTKIVIAGSVVVLQSAHTMKELEKVAAYKPESLTLKDKDGAMYFSVLPGSFGNIEAGNITYSETTPDGSGKACVTLPLPTGTGDIKKIVAQAYGPAIANANKVEAQIDAALDEVNEMLTAVEAQIVFAGSEAAEANEAAAE